MISFHISAEAAKTVPGSSYGNYLSDEGDPVARAAYGANYDRLAALKRRYDPTNFFRMNHNIKPASRPAVA